MCGGTDKCSWDGDPGFIWCGRSHVKAGEKVDDYACLGPCKNTEFSQFRHKDDPALKARNEEKATHGLLDRPRVALFNTNGR